MTNLETVEMIASIRKIQENIALSIGVTLAMTLSVYFFTYAMAVDQGYMTVLWGMGVSSVVMVLILFRLQDVSFFVVRLWLGRRPAYRDIFPKISATQDASGRDQGSAGK